MAHRRAHLRAAQAASEMSEQTDVVRRRVYVRMAEIYQRHVVLTLESDFSAYRKHSRLPPTHSPGGRIDNRNHHYAGFGHKRTEPRGRARAPTRCSCRAEIPWLLNRLGPPVGLRQATEAVN